MERIELQLDEQTLEQARRLAESHHCTLDQLIKDLIEQLGTAQMRPDPVLGMFNQEPEFVDQVIESAMRSREEHSLRQPLG